MANEESESKSKSKSKERIERVLQSVIDKFILYSFRGGDSFYQFMHAFLTREEYIIWTREANIWYQQTQTHNDGGYIGSQYALFMKEKIGFSNKQEKEWHLEQLRIKEENKHVTQIQ